MVEFPVAGRFVGEYSLVHFTGGNTAPQVGRT
jgi:hypothetical protein